MNRILYFNIGVGITNYHVLKGASTATIKLYDKTSLHIPEIVTSNASADLIEFEFNLEPEAKQGLAKHHYEEFIKFTSGDKEKYNKDLITAKNFLGYYYLKRDKANATKHWQEVKH